MNEIRGNVIWSLVIISALWMLIYLVVLSCDAMLTGNNTEHETNIYNMPT